MTRTREGKGSKQLWVLTLASLGAFMVALDGLVVTTALTTIRRDLDASVVQLEWTINAFTLSFAVLVMTGAALGDRFGRRRLFVGGLALFTAPSIGCALAPDVGWLIASRRAGRRRRARDAARACAFERRVPCCPPRDAVPACPPNPLARRPR